MFIGGRERQLPTLCCRSNYRKPDSRAQVGLAECELVSAGERPAYKAFMHIIGNRICKQKSGPLVQIHHVTEGADR